MAEITVVFRDGFIRSLPNLPAGIRVFVYDYDLNKHDESQHELDPVGNKCVATIYSHIIKGEEPISVTIAVRKKRIQIVKCPKSIVIKVI